MREKLAETFEVSINKVNIKAKTTEGLGFCGREEGIETFAVVSLVKDYEEKSP
jgi:2-C-methyl-D-erythritol 2,4-cyclodiphosphate synthase